MSAKQQKVIKFCIKNSPVGEQKDILDDISNIIGAEAINTPEVKQALRDYYEEHLYHLEIEGQERKVVIDALGRQEPIIRYA
jgi:hypothetical protein